MVLTLGEIKNRKAPDIGEISDELLKKASEKRLNSLYYITRDIIYGTGIIADDYCNNGIVTLLKKNKATSCGNFRTLSLLPLMCLNIDENCIQENS